MINVELKLPEFSKMVDTVSTKKDIDKVILSHLAFNETEYELFGSAIKYCCDFRKVNMIVVGEPKNNKSISVNTEEFEYGDVISLGKKVKELAKKYYEVIIPAQSSRFECSNCGNEK